MYRIICFTLFTEEALTSVSKIDGSTHLRNIKCGIKVSEEVTLFAEVYIMLKFQAR